jgi:hypothetical protein
MPHVPEAPLAGDQAHRQVDAGGPQPPLNARRHLALAQAGGDLAEHVRQGTAPRRPHRGQPRLLDGQQRLAQVGQVGLHVVEAGPPLDQARHAPAARAGIVPGDDLDPRPRRQLLRLEARGLDAVRHHRQSVAGHDRVGDRRPLAVHQEVAAARDPGQVLRAPQPDHVRLAGVEQGGDARHLGR